MWSVDIYFVVNGSSFKVCGDNGRSFDDNFPNFVLNFLAFVYINILRLYI